MHSDQHPQRRTTLRVPRSKHRGNGTPPRQQPKRVDAHEALLREWVGQVIMIVSVNDETAYGKLLELDKWSLILETVPVFEDQEDGFGTKVIIYKHAIKSIELAQKW